jgi:putative transcriptional regulator
MKPKSDENDRMVKELLDTMADLSTCGLISKSDLARAGILGETPPVYEPARVVKIRTGMAKMSQSVFAAWLNVSVSTVQKWESPTANKHPSGAAAKLLQMVETKGIESLLV